jgi:hypothetical protein
MELTMLFKPLSLGDRILNYHYRHCQYFNVFVLYSLEKREKKEKKMQIWKFENQFPSCDPMSKV